MSSWIERARASALAQDQAWKQNSYGERIRRAGEEARRKKRTVYTQPAAEPAPAPAETTANTVKLLPVQSNSTQNNYLLADSLKNLPDTVNEKLATDGAFANAAVENLQKNGLPEVADSLKSQLDALERERHIADWEANRTASDLWKKSEAEQIRLNELFKQRDLYIGMMIGGPLNDKQQAELSGIETQIKESWDLLDDYKERAETKETDDWRKRNLAEIRQAEQEVWNPMDRQKKLSALRAAPLSAQEQMNPTAVAKREREVSVLESDFLERLCEGVHNPNTKKQLTKELVEHGYSKQQISSWFDYAEHIEDAEDYEKATEIAYRLSRDYLKSKNSLIGAVPFSLGSGIGYLGALGQKVENALTGKDTPINYKSTAMLPRAIADGLRQGGSDRVAERTMNGLPGKVLNWINPEWDGSTLAAVNSLGYNLAGSLADGAAVVAMSAAGVPAWVGTFALGSSTATTAMQEAHERGATERQSLWIGGIAGLTEMLFSDAAIEKIINLKNPQMAKQLVFNKLPMKGVMEIAGDAGVNVVNTVVDTAVMKDKSKLVKTKQTYMMNGYSEADAKRMAVRDWSVDLALDVGIGRVVNLSSAAAAKASQIKWRENASSSQISDFVTNAYNNKNTHGYLRLFEASDDLAANLRGTGIDVNGYVHVLQDNDIRHIRKSHGDLSNAKHKVTSEDITNAVKLIGNYDKLYLGKDIKTGRNVVVYEKTTDQKFFLVEEISSDGTLITKQIIKTGKHNKPNFLQKYKLITDRTSETDVPAKPDPTGQIDPPSKHVQDAEEAVSYNTSVSPENGFVKGEKTDLAEIDEALWERLFLLGFERGLS